jgi:hypothetical protein
VNLRVQLLKWIVQQPRTYGETMDAWRSTCPRLSVWEDAVADGLVRVRHGPSMLEARVTLTARGRQAIKESGA